MVLKERERLEYVLILHGGRISGGLLFGTIIYAVIKYILPMIGFEYNLHFLICFLIGFLIRTNVYYKVNFKWD